MAFLLALTLHWIKKDSKEGKMKRKHISGLVLAAATASILVAAHASADTSISINVGSPSPPPRLVVASPPPVVVVPGTPVYHVPTASFNLFVYDGQYYSFHNGAWFIATGRGGPWTLIATDVVPRSVIAVPVQYYKIPPGHAKKMNGGPPYGPPGHAKGHKGKGKKGYDD